MPTQGNSGGNGGGSGSLQSRAPTLGPGESAKPSAAPSSANGKALSSSTVDGSLSSETMIILIPLMVLLFCCGLCVGAYFVYIRKKKNAAEAPDVILESSGGIMDSPQLIDVYASTHKDDHISPVNPLHQSSFSPGSGVAKKMGPEKSIDADPASQEGYLHQKYDHYYPKDTQNPMYAGDEYDETIPAPPPLPSPSSRRASSLAAAECLDSLTHQGSLPPAATALRRMSKKGLIESSLSANRAKSLARTADHRSVEDSLGQATQNPMSTEDSVRDMDRCGENGPVHVPQRRMSERLSLEADHEMRGNSVRRMSQLHH